MHRLLLWSGAFVGILGLAIGLVLFMGRTRPFSPQVQWWHLADCQLPCLAGITVGQTTLGEAEQRIGEVFGPVGFAEVERQPGDNGTYRLTWMREEGDPQPTMYHVQLTFARELASSMALGTNAGTRETMPTLAEILILFGPPSCLSMDAGNPEVTLIFDHAWAQGSLFVITDAGIGMTSHIDFIMATNVEGNVNCRANGHHDWRGFTSRHSLQ